MATPYYSGGDPDGGGLLLQAASSYDPVEPALPMRVPSTTPGVRCADVLRFRPRAHTVGVFLAAFAAAALPGQALADIFTYTDDEGVVHFSNKPANDGRYRLYLKSLRQRGRRAGVVPVMPSDSSPDRFTRYDEWIRQAAILYQIPEELIRAVIMCESNYDPRAVSPTGAQGLMQMMPETATRMQVRDAFDPRENIFGGTRYLRVLANMFNGDLELTIAGYNAGEGAVVRYAGIPPFEETQQYVIRVLTYYRRYRTIGDPLLASSTY